MITETVPGEPPAGGDFRVPLSEGLGCALPCEHLCLQADAVSLCGQPGAGSRRRGLRSCRA